MPVFNKAERFGSWPHTSCAGICKQGTSCRIHGNRKCKRRTGAVIHKNRSAVLNACASQRAGAAVIRFNIGKIRIRANAFCIQNAGHLVIIYKTGSGIRTVCSSICSCLSRSPSLHGSKLRVQVVVRVIYFICIPNARRYEKICKIRVIPSLIGIDKVGIRRAAFKPCFHLINEVFKFLSTMLRSIRTERHCGKGGEHHNCCKERSKKPPGLFCFH